MTLLIFGKTGQVARELAARAPDATFLSRAEADLADPVACAEAIRAAAPSCVINAAAWTAVDAAEEHEKEALVINGETPGTMAATCAEMSIPFLHVSTDYVFDGSGDIPWKEDAPTAPLSAYGRSKLAGEEAIARAGGAWVILRTAWVFSSHGNNFVKTMLRLAGSRDALNIVNDQHGGPTPAAAIAEALLSIAGAFAASRGTSGIYHFAGQPHCTWADFAAEIFSQAGKSIAITGIPTTEFPTPATRPANSRLDGAKLLADYGIAPPDWRQGLADVLKEIDNG